MKLLSLLTLLVLMTISSQASAGKRTDQCADFGADFCLVFAHFAKFEDVGSTSECQDTCAETEACQSFKYMFEGSQSQTCLLFDFDFQNTLKRVKVPTWIRS